MQITIGATTLPNYQAGGSVATLRIYVTDNFFGGGVEYVAGQGYFYQEVACTVSGSTVTIPSFALESTTDSNVDTAKYVAVLYDHNGTKVTTLMGGTEFSVPPATPTSWTALMVYNQATVRRLTDDYYTANQVQALLNNPDITPDATSTLKGKVKLDVDPASPAAPIAVGSNSPKVLSVLAVDYGNDLSAAITAIGSTPAHLTVSSNATVSTALTVPSTLKLDVKKGSVITKSGSGTINFQGIGLADPQSQDAVFSGFAPGDITWTGANYPARLSSSLWAGANLDAKLNNATAALNGKSAVVTAFPNVLANGITVPSGITIELQSGTFTSTVSNVAAAMFLMSDNTALIGQGDGRTIFQESANNLQFVRGTGVAAPPFAGFNQNIRVEGITFLGNNATAVNSAFAAVLLGNVTNGVVRNCVFDHTHGFAAYVGGFGNNGYTANGVWIENNLVTGLQTQNIGTVGGKNVYIRGNTFLLGQPVTAPFTAVIDIEPNAGSDGTENLFITDNIIDGRGAHQNYNGITVQRAYGSYMRNVVVARNRIIGAVPERFTFSAATMNLPANTITVYGHGLETGWEVSICNDTTGDCGTTLPDLAGNPLAFAIKVDQDHFKLASSYANAIAGIPITLTSAGAYRWSLTNASYLSAGIQLFAADNSVVEDNVVSGANQQGFWASGGSYNTIRRNILRKAGGGGIHALQLTNLSHSDIVGNILRVGSGTVGVRDASIFEEDLPITVSTTAGSPNVVVTTDKALPYNLAGLNITINSVTYGIAAVQFQTLVLTTNAASTLSSVSAQLQYSTNRYVGNDAQTITLSPIGTSRLISDFTRVVSDSYAPAQITADQNDYNPGQNSYRLDLATNASRNITGLTFTDVIPVNGEKHLIYNAGGNPVVIKNESASSAAANRFHNSSGADITLTAGQGATLEYNATLSRWVAFKMADVSLAGAETLTNKTIDASANTLTNIGTSALSNSAVTLGKIQNATANSKLLGSGSAGIGVPYSELTLGTNLSMSGTTLNAAGGGVAVGNAVSGGGVNRVLYEDGSQNLASNANFTYGASASTLALTQGAATDVPFRITQAASPSGNAIEINSSAGSGGDKFKIDSAGNIVMPNDAVLKGGSQNLATYNSGAARVDLGPFGGNTKVNGSTLYLGDNALAAITGNTGKMSTYGGISTVGNGVPAEYATVDLTAQSAAIAATTLYAVPASGTGMYRISFVAKVTTAATTSSTLGGAGGFQVLYTDKDDSVVVTTGAVQNLSGATLTGNTTQTVYSGVMYVNAKASTNLQYQFGYTSSGATSMAYNLHIKVEAM